MPRITPRKPKETIVVKTGSGSKQLSKPGDWWNADSKQERCNRLLGTAAFLKEQNQYRHSQAALYARLYGNMPMSGMFGASSMRMNSKSQLPPDRPTMSVITSCTDTLVSRISQSRPRPLFLTDNGDYKQRKLSKDLNSFIAGEFYQTEAYDLGELILRDSCVWGTGVLKVLEGQGGKVSLERRLATQLMVDANEAFLGYPRQLYELQLVDRAVLAECFPEYRSMIQKAEQAFPEQSAEADKTVSDQVMVVEAWRLPSGKDSGDGMHVIGCSAGMIAEEEYTKKKFPFAFFNYSPPQVGFWGDGLAFRQKGTQTAINQLLMTIHTAINLVGVPRVFVEDGSMVVKAHLNNSIGSIVTYRGTKPSYEVAPCVPVELYQQLERLVQFAYQQEGISQLSSTSQKPAGLNSGEALRQYDDIQSDRFAYLQKRYEKFYIDLAYLILDQAVDIAKRDGKYQTVYPNKDGAKEINLPHVKELENPFVIQCYDVSSLPRDPSGRLQKVTEMMQAGIVSPQEGRRLLNFPDIEQEDKLANAAEERILQVLDLIVEEGKYTPPDPFTDIALAETIVTQYYNLYGQAKLEEEKMQMLRDFSSQLQALKSQAALAMQPQGGQPQANPMPTPQSELIQNVPGPQGVA